MKKRVFMIHGWGGRPDEHWLPWVREKLEEKRFEVDNLNMPHTDEPIIEEWVDYLTHKVREPDKNTYFVGHSIGCQTIMRYLARLDNQKIGGCVFVAGWFKLENLEDEETEQLAEPWVKDDIDFTKVLSTTKNFVVINSSNDDYGAVQENKKLFEEKLGAKVIVLENMGHFCEADGVSELPEVVQGIEGFINHGNK